MGFTKELDAIDTLTARATEHDKDCPDVEHEGHAEGCNATKCWDHRAKIVALMMYRFGLELVDLGQIAESFLEVSAEIETAPVPEDDVINASEITTE